MLFKNAFLTTVCISIFLSAKGYALTRFPKGICTLEGFLAKATNEENWYFIVNPTTNAETRFRLKAFSPSSQVSEKGQYIVGTLNILNETFSLYGEANFKKVEKFINPYDDVKTYDSESDVRQACPLDRYPSSITGSIKNKKIK